MLKKGPLKILDKIAAYSLSIICISAGSIGLFLSIYNYKTIIIPIVAMAFIILGIFYGIAAFKGRAINDISKRSKKDFYS